MNFTLSFLPNLTRSLTCRLSRILSSSGALLRMMRRSGLLLCALPFIATLLAGPAPVTAAPAADRILIAYFSRTGENYGVGRITKGNTEIIAEKLALITGGTLFKIEPVDAYPESYKECTTQAHEEFNQNARPAIKQDVPDFDSYDVILVGYPIWWSDVPMPVLTFLEKHNFNGKRVAGFSTHAGSGLGRTEATLKQICEGAKLLPGLAIYGTEAQKDPDGAARKVADWVARLRLKLR